MSQAERGGERPVVAGYRLLHVIGEGSAAVVWSGVDAMRRPVAIKVPHAGPDPVDVRQAELERHVLTAVRHEHLVPLRAVVPLDDGRVALVFDLVVGATLASIVEHRGHLEPGEVVTLLTPIAAAVAALHAAGGMHCDISAGNVMVTADGRPLLMDLGAARLAGSGAGAVVGTPGFVAPEVRDGESPSEASDVYSIGALAWFCRTGNGAPDTMVRLSEETLRSHLGDELADVVGACIDPEPAARPPSDTLAERIYAAAPARPVEVVVGADEAAALTHRLRAEAAADPASGVERRQGRGGAHATRSWFRVPLRTRGRWPRRAGSIIGLTVTTLTVTALAITALAVTLGPLGRPSGAPGGERVPLQSRSSADPVAGGAPVTDPGGVAPTRPTGRAEPAGRARDDTAATAALLLSAAAPRQRPRAVLQALADRRSRALVDRDAAALAGVHRRGSPAWQEDAQVIAALLTAHRRYVGLALTVGPANHRSGTDQRAVIRARVDVGAYVVLTDDGERSPQPAVPGELLDFTLVRQADGWRLEAISEPAAS